MTARSRILFFGEAVSLAHVVRPLVLALALDPERYDIHFACDPRFSGVLGRASQIQRHPLRSISSEEFLEAASRADFALSDQDLVDYLAQDLDLLRDLRPALVVSDFRFTVAIAAELTETIHATLVNAHWSPYRQLGFDSNPGFGVQAKRSASAAINEVRNQHGLPLVEGYCDLITRADFTLYPEPEGLIATVDLPKDHLFIGPLLWSPDVEKPSWWGTWSKKLPIVYVTLGSTGLASKLPMLIDSLQDLSVNILVATAGRGTLQTTNRLRNVYVADYLPGDELARLADVVICNGGSATTYQALHQGTPVIGLWSNLDQYLTSTVIQQAGAGISVHADDLGADSAAWLVSTVLQARQFCANAIRLRDMFTATRGPEQFRAFIEHTVA